MNMLQPDIRLQHDGVLRIAIGRSRKETNWKNQEMTWSQFLARISATHRTIETYDEYMKSLKAKQDDIKDVGGFVGGILKEGRRKAGNIGWRQLLTLDADFANTEFWGKVQSVFSDCAAAIYSTHKHNTATPRYRLVIPLSRAVKPDEYKAIGHRVAADIGIDLFDDTTYEPERLMYWPSTSADAPFDFQYQDGIWLDADAQLARYPDWRDPSYWPESSRTKTERKKMADKQGDPLEKPGLIGAFCRTYTIADAIAKFLPDVYEPTEAPDRFTFTQGSTVGGLVIYDEKFAFSHHGTDPASGKLCNAFDLVRIHKYGDRDDEAKDNTPINKKPSYIAMCELASNDDATKIELATVGLVEAAARFGEADDTDESDDRSWSKKLKRSDNGSLAQTIENAVIILENDPWLKGRIRLNEFSYKPEIIKDLPWRKIPSNAQTATVWSDSDDSGLRFYLEKKYTYSAVNKLNDAVAIILDQNKYHPVCEYLQDLIWDGQERVENILIRSLGAEDSAYTRAVTRKALVAAVARVMTPGVKFDYMLTLVGKQGLGKSGLLKAIGGKWHSDSLTTVTGKEAYELLQGFWIMEMSELTATKKADIESIKLFLSKQVDTYRAPYDKRTVDHPRQCIIIGTTNDWDFLRDRTGNRRFWPVRCGINEIETPWFKLTKDYIDQVWAEAFYIWSHGEELYLDDAVVEAEAKKLQSEHTEDSGKAGIINEYLDRLLPENWYELGLSERRAFFEGFYPEMEGKMQRTRVCILEIQEECFGVSRRDLKQSDSREIAEIMRNMQGWRQLNVQRFKNGYGSQRAFGRD